MKDVVDFFSVVGSIATVATAVTAIWALNLWHKQITGASDHELAKKLSGALRQVQLARDVTIKDLKVLGSADLNGQIARMLFVEQKRANAQLLDTAVKALAELEGSIAVQWGDAMLRLVELIRSESSSLAVHALSATAPGVHSTLRVFLASWPDNDSTLAPSYLGTAYSKALDGYTKLAQGWLAVHVGREGAKAMSQADLIEKRKQADDEAKRLAEPERNTIEQQCAQWIAEHGGEEAAMKRVFQGQENEGGLRELLALVKAHVLADKPSTTK